MVGARAAGPMIRKATIHRFPYVIAFEKHEQHVLVLAVAHAKRRPLYWLTPRDPLSVCPKCLQNAGPSAEDDREDAS